MITRVHLGFVVGTFLTSLLMLSSANAEDLEIAPNPYIFGRSDLITDTVLVKSTGDLRGATVTVNGTPTSSTQVSANVLCVQLTYSLTEGIPVIIGIETGTGESYEKEIPGIIVTTPEEALAALLDATDEIRDFMALGYALLAEKGGAEVSLARSADAVDEAVEDSLADIATFHTCVHDLLRGLSVAFSEFVSAWLDANPGEENEERAEEASEQAEDACEQAQEANDEEQDQATEQVEEQGDVRKEVLDVNATVIPVVNEPKTAKSDVEYEFEGNEAEGTSPDTGESVKVEDKVENTDSGHTTKFFGQPGTDQPTGGTGLVEPDVDCGPHIVITVAGVEEDSKWAFVQFKRFAWMVFAAGANQPDPDRSGAALDWKLDYPPDEVVRKMQSLGMTVPPSPQYASQAQSPDGGQVMRDIPSVTNPWDKFAEGETIVLIQQFKTWIVRLEPSLLIIGHWTWGVRTVITVGSNRETTSFTSMMIAPAPGKDWRDPRTWQPGEPQWTDGNADDQYDELYATQLRGPHPWIVP